MFLVQKQFRKSNKGYGNSQKQHSYKPSPNKPSGCRTSVQKQHKDSSQQRQGPPQPRCAFCNGTHRSVDCRKVLTLKLRSDVASEKRLCFNCLKAGHIVRECLSRFRCTLCHNKHHTALHPTDKDQGDPQEKSNAVRLEQSEDVTSTVTLTPASQRNMGGTVLLMIASARILNGNRAATINILLDKGAQRTFITESVTRDLGLISSGSEIINLSTFGAQQVSKRREVKVVNLQQQTISGENIDISALVVPKITTSMKNFAPAASTAYSYLEDLDLADHIEGTTFNIDLLIGADLYWSIVEDKEVRGPGPTAVASKLGYLLSGP